MRQKNSGRVSTQHKGSRGGTLLGMFIGLIVGILIALAVVWFINRSPNPFKSPPGQPEPTGVATRNAANGSNGSNGNNGGAAGNGNAAPAALPGKPGDAPAEKRFQFYDILPGKSEPKPDAKPDPKAAEKAAPTGKSDVKASGPLSLQVGSFQTIKDAENMKATLAMMGVEPAIQEVSVNGKQWFRVRVGPMMSFEELNRIKTELAKSGIQAVVVKPNE